MAKEVSQSVVSLNQKINEFKEKFQPTISKACYDAKLNRCDWQLVVSDVCNKFFVTHEAQFDENYHKNGKTANEFGQVYRIAKNCALNIVRQEHRDRVSYVDNTKIERGLGSSMAEGTPEIDTEVWSAFVDQQTSFEEEFTEEDVSLLRKQALVRLYLKSENKTHVEMFVRRLFFEHTVEQLAKEYGQREANVSLICTTRLKPQYEAIVRQILREDEHGRLQLLDEREISFLGKYLKQL